MTHAEIISTMQSAIRQVQSGQFHQASATLNRLLKQAPRFADAHHLLGIIALQTGALDSGIARIRRAIALSPNVAAYHSNLGDALRQKGDYDAAILECRSAIQLQPAFPEAHNNLANALRMAGRIDEAAEAYRTTVRLKPDYAEAFSNLGNMLAERKQLLGPLGAIAAFQEALKLRPNLPDIHINLGCALRDTGRTDEAIELYRSSLALQPDNPAILSNLASALVEKGACDEAVQLCLRALAIKPEYPEACNNLGNAYRGLRSFHEAATAYRRAIALKSDLVEAHMNLGIALHDLGLVDEGVESCRRAIQIQPECAEAHFNLGNMLHHQGRLRESIASYHQAIRLRPRYSNAYCNLAGALIDLGELTEGMAACEKSIELDPELALVHSNLAYFQLLHPQTDAAKNLAVARRWAAQLESTVARQIQPHLNNRSPDRRLKVGYVSSDFCHHPVGWFLRGLLPYHDLRNVEVVCYSDVKQDDDVTRELRRSAQAWLETRSFSDDQLAEQIRADEIDVLVDLAAHTNGNRLRVFARKPAPVQITWLGYPGTTGLKNMDYRLTDPFIDPPGDADQFYTEKSIRLPHCFWCYAPNDAASEVAPLPLESNGYLTFGSTNKSNKVTDDVLHLWALLLASIPHSRLRIVMERDRQERALAVFAARGIHANRIEFVRRQHIGAYFQDYNSIDIALDPFPYAGGTTTCDALWMGVPTITLRGNTSVGRGGVSILSNVGLTDWIANTQQEYLTIAIKMAADAPKLAELRAQLRQKMLQSPLMDSNMFAADMEAAYRKMWKQWCAAGK